MTIYEQILEDEQIRSLYDWIDEKEKDSSETLHHGWVHIAQVMENMENLLILAGDEDRIEAGKIAALLHDIGKVKGSKGHAERSFRMAEKYLKQTGIHIPHQKKVLKAIRVHSDGFDSHSLLALALILADKTDLCHQRLLPEGEKTPGVRQIAHIRRVEYELEKSEFGGGEFRVNFITDGELDREELETYPFLKKVFAAARAFARRLHCCPSVRIDGKVWNLYSQVLKIAFLQLMPAHIPSDQADDGLFIQTQLVRGLHAMEEAKKMGADIALFPEMWSCGYQIPEDPQTLAELAVPADGTFVKAFAEKAKELEMAVAVTILEKADPAPRNSVILIDRFGNTLYNYAKVHTCDFGDESRLTPGEEFFVAELDTACGPVKTGSMICFDREFPESARILMLKGAELILTPNACPMEINRLAGLRARANENMLAIATCNYPEGKPDCNGHSTLFDGVMYTPDSEGSLDTCLLETGGKEGIYLGELDLDRLRNYRSYEVHGNAFRRPGLYHLLTEEKVEEPFVRPERKTR